MAKKVIWGAKQLRLNLSAELGRDVTLEEVSQQTGIEIGTLSRIENNKGRGVKFATLEKLAEFYRLDNTAALLVIEDKRRAAGLVPVGV